MSSGQREQERVDAPHASFPQFVLWCLKALGVEAQPEASGVYRLDVPVAAVDGAPAPPHPYATLAGRRIRFGEAPAEATSGAVEPVAHGSPFVDWLRRELAGPALPLHAVAAHQPLTVHELTRTLFAPYVVEGGRVHLAGCTLEDRPFLRLTFLRTAADVAAPMLLHCYGASDGTLVPAGLADALELHQVAVPPWRVPGLDRAVVEQWTRVTISQCAALADGAPGTLLATTVVWCRHAEGKLALSIGSKSVEVSFGGWARLLADGQVQPPPYRCPLSGLSSYHLTATDDGRITVAEAIACCAVSGQRVLYSDLERCAVTGQEVLPAYLQTCPVTGRRVLASLFQTCPMCRQRVSPLGLEGPRCRACERLAVTPKADPRLARVLGAFPRLDHWRRWKLSETETVQILVGSAFWQRVLLVVDKQTLDVLHLATGTRWSRQWTEATAVERNDWVG